MSNEGYFTDYKLHIWQDRTFRVWEKNDMSMAFPYCNTTSDLQGVMKDIERFAGKDTLVTFTLTSGQASTYEKRHTGYIGIVYQNGAALTEKTTIADVESNASSFYYNSTTDILYVHMDDGNDPDTADTITVAVDDWATFKTSMRNRASQQLESLLDRKYPRPLPFAMEQYNDFNYDSDIVMACAILTCINIIQSRDIDHPLLKTLWDKVWNPEEEKGVIWEYNQGIRAFSFEATGDEFNGNIQPLIVDSSSSGLIHLAGKGDRGTLRKVIVLITTGGAVGAAKWKYSLDNETSWSSIVTTTINYQHLTNEVFLKFSGTFVANDKWQVDILGDEYETNPKIRSVILRVNK